LQLFSCCFYKQPIAADFGKNKAGSSDEMQGLTVRGVVKDASTNEAMPGVNIKVNGTTLAPLPMLTADTHLPRLTEMLLWYLLLLVM